MNHIFAPYLGVFMDVYLDDIVIYSDSLSASKLHFLEREMKVLGRIVDDQGIRMDPDKVVSVLAWKVPTSKELLRGFLGSVGYLADDVADVRIPMGVQRASAPRIWLVTDGSLGGISGVVSQGDTWNGGRVAAFFSAKLSSAQMNYPVHEIEMLAGVEAMLRHRDI